MPTLKNMARGARQKYYVALSFFLSGLTTKASRTEFDAAYADAKKLYEANSAQYDYAAYIMPSWKSNTDKMEAYFRNGFSFNFLRNIVVQQTMFVHSYGRQRSIQKTLLESYFPKEKLKSLLKETNVGAPMLNDAAYISSGNSIHLLYHLAKFFTETKTAADAIHSVVEVGGGYGHMAKHFRNLNPEVTYTIIDIPIFSYIQYVYLRTIFGESNVHLLQKNDSRIRPGKINLLPLDETILKDAAPQLNNTDLFLSTWALSESNQKMQQTVVDRHYFNAKYLLLAYQKQSGEFTYAEKVADTAPDYAKVFAEETDYLKENYYLFCRKSS